MSLSQVRFYELPLGDWRAIAWVLERGWPADWGLKREIEVSTTNTNKGAYMVLEMLRQADEREKD